MAIINVSTELENKLLELEGSAGFELKGVCASLACILSGEGETKRARREKINISLDRAKREKF